VGNKKVLIVDDDPDIRLGMNVRLKANNYDTFFAADASAALIEAEKHRPEVIILDLGLPGDDGFVVMERLKQVPCVAEIPIIVVSARDIRVNQARSMEAGAKAFLRKPFDDGELLGLIRDTTGEPAPLEELSRHNRRSM
jgi:two-component system, OmpR family, KDP operon response regulator KdpE